MRAALLLAALGLAVNVWSLTRSPPLPTPSRHCTLRAVTPRPAVAIPRRHAR